MLIWMQRLSFTFGKKKKHEKDDHFKNNSFLKLKKKWKNEFTQAEFYQP